MTLRGQGVAHRPDWPIKSPAGVKFLHPASVSMHPSIHPSIYLPIHLSICIISAYVSICMFVCTCVRTYGWMDGCMYVCSLHGKTIWSWRTWGDSALHHKAPCLLGEGLSCNWGKLSCCTGRLVPHSFSSTLSFALGIQCRPRINKSPRLINLRLDRFLTNKWPESLP